MSIVVAGAAALAAAANKNGDDLFSVRNVQETQTRVIDGTSLEDGMQIGDVPMYLKFIRFFAYWNVCGAVIFGIYYSYKRFFLDPHLRGGSGRTVEEDDDSDGYGDDSEDGTPSALLPRDRSERAAFELLQRDV